MTCDMRSTLKLSYPMEKIQKNLFQQRAAESHIMSVTFEAESLFAVWQFRNCNRNESKSK